MLGTVDQWRAGSVICPAGWPGDCDYDPARNAAFAAGGAFMDELAKHLWS